MKILSPILGSILCWFFVQAYPVLASTSEDELICPDSNPLNCYPKLFQATEDWQLVKDGQIIPVGLDIRLDLENLKREAKLMSNIKNNNFETKKNHELVVSNLDEGFQSSLDFIVNFVNSKSDTKIKNVIFDHLETLIEWASDRESGLILAHHVQPILKLSGLYHDENNGSLKYETFGLDNSEYKRVQEMSYRVLSTTFRNNVDAQEILLDYISKPEEFLQHLVNIDKYDNNLIIQRKLGLLSSLLNNGLFEKWFKIGGIENRLLALYSKMNDVSINQRIMNILEDNRLYKRSESDVLQPDDSTDSLDLKYAIIAQDAMITSNSIENNDSMEILDGLEKIKLSNKNAFKVKSEFLNWLDVQINREKEALELRKRDDTNNYKRLVELRHQVFGNPLGSRRDDIDEL
jgi:nucleotide exchange factor SIL1